MAATGDVIASFPAPSSGPFGMAWDGTNLWNADDSTGRTYELTTAGTVVSSFVSPVAFLKGLTFDGTNLWAAADGPDLIYKLTKTGTIVSTIPTPGPTVRGLTWDGTNLWVADAGTNLVYQLTTAGAVVSSFAAPSSNSRGLTWDGTNLWLADATTDLVYQLTTAGTVLSSFSTPAGDPRGLTIDGTDFWLSDNSTDLIYRLAGTGQTISGTVFEDVNYGGGAGRSRAASFGVVRSGVRMELYNNAGSYVTFATTDGSGNYSFPGLAAGNYTVRVVNSTVTSSRTGYVAGLWPVQTFRTNASSGSAVAVTDHVGGEVPGKSDAGNGSTTLAALTTATTTAQSITPVTIGGGNITGVDFGFNFNTIVNTDDTGQGSLRQFIINANTLGGDAGLSQAGRTAGAENAIFMLSDGTARPGMNTGYVSMFTGGVATVSPASVLPTITQPIILDAQTQPGWTSAPIVELSGGGSVADGLTINAGGSAVRGLVINRFSNNGIQINSMNTLIAGNWIGVDSSGTIDQGNGVDGIRVSGNNNTIGGTAAADRNVLSGNDDEGLDIDPAVAGTVVLGNYIGTNLSGNAGIPNGLSADLQSGGLLVDGDNNRIGGSAAGEGNVISGNYHSGLRMNGVGNSAQGNRIGTDASGNFPLANDGFGIGISGFAGGANNAIGGTGGGEGNIIAFNTGNGVQLEATAGVGNRILGNSINSNTVLGIDLGDNGVTANNGTKNGTLPNSDMDFPVFTSATLNGSTLTVSGYVGSTAGQSAFANARVEIFKSDNDGSGYGEGQTYLDFLTTDANGNFSGSLTVGGLAAGDSITGTATDGSNNTSEFGGNATVAAPGYQPDAMIKLASEGAGGYLTGDLYEATASAQSKSLGVVSGSTASYHVLFQNDGNITDNLVITGTASGSGFTVQYLDNTAIDRTTDVTGAGYTISGIAVGASTMWIVNVTPAGTVVGGASYNVFVTTVSGTDNTKIDQVEAVSSSISADLTLLKSADKANAAPGEDITYTVNASNSSGLSAADNVVLTDPIPANTGFKMGGATFNADTSTLSFTVVYSDDNGSTWAYTPASGGCGAPAGYDDCVTNVKWTGTGSMPTGTGFRVGLEVRVK